MQEMEFIETLLTLNKSNTILTESKPEVQKILICLKPIEGTAESSGATRFSKTFFEVLQIIVTKPQNGKLMQASMRRKIRHLKILGNMCITIVS